MKHLKIMLCLTLMLNGCKTLQTGEKTPYQIAEQAAKVASTTFDIVNEFTYDEIARLVIQGNLSQIEVAELEVLNAMREPLSDFRITLNAYVSLLKLWKQSGEKPIGFDNAMSRLSNASQIVIYAYQQVLKE